MARNDRADGLTVAEMAAMTGLSAHTLRYYERVGLIRPVSRNRENQRRYQPEDVEWVRFLMRLRETGMPIARMQEYAELRFDGDTTVAARLDLLAAHHEHLHRQIDSLRTHEQALLVKIDTYRRMVADVPTEGDGADE